MPGIVDLCNAALSHCGTRSKIAALDEGSPEANACRTHFDLMRDMTLRAFDWNFARLTVALAQLENPPQRWAYKYALPTDCLRLRRLNDVPLLRLPETFYEVAADRDGSGAIVGVILTDAPAVSAIYTAQVTDTGRWDAGFADAMTYGLAARLCFELTGKDDRARTLTQMWQGLLQRAGADMANEGSALNRAYVPQSLAVRGYDSGLDDGCRPHWER